MKAVRIHGYGGADQLRVDEVAVPEPGADEVLVRVEAAGVNPVDWKIRADLTGGMLPIDFPATLGTEVAGTVSKVGPGVADYSPGDEVFAHQGFLGGYAEYVVAPVASLARKPDNIDFARASSVPMPGLTAWKAMVEIAGIGAGQTVLIHGAAGGVGSIAVQIAKARGARVIGTASAANEARLRELGVDEFVDYRKQPFEDVVQDVDMVFDLIGGDTEARSLKVLKPGGLLVTAAMPPNVEAATAANVRAAFVAVGPNGAALAELGKLIEDGRVRIAEPQMFTMDKAADAHALSETGHSARRIVLATKGA